MRTGVFQQEWSHVRHGAWHSPVVIYSPRAFCKVGILPKLLQPRTTNWGGLKPQNLSSHRAGGWKSKIRVSVGLVPSKHSGEELLHTSLVLLLTSGNTRRFLPCRHITPVSAQSSDDVLISSSYRDACHIGSGPTRLQYDLRSA